MVSPPRFAGRDGNWIAPLLSQRPVAQAGEIEGMNLAQQFDETFRAALQRRLALFADASVASPTAPVGLRSCVIQAKPAGR